MTAAREINKRYLRKIMGDYGLTGLEVAKLLKMKHQSVRAIMCGVRPLKMRHLLKLERRLGI